jgi:hypothetical protein
MKATIIIAITALSLSVAAANAQSHYRTPAHNFYQNNWTSR